MDEDRQDVGLPGGKAKVAGLEYDGEDEDAAGADGAKRQYKIVPTDADADDVVGGGAAGRGLVRTVPHPVRETARCALERRL